MVHDMVRLAVTAAAVSSLIVGFTRIVVLETPLAALAPSQPWEFVLALAPWSNALVIGAVLALASLGVFFWTFWDMGTYDSASAKSTPPSAATKVLSTGSLDLGSDAVQASPSRPQERRSLVESDKEVERVVAVRGTKAAGHMIASGRPVEGRERVGVACSGGGLRSAAFQVGAIGALLDHDEAPKIDFLSSVSGGGYTVCGLMVRCVDLFLTREQRPPMAAVEYSSFRSVARVALGHMRDAMSRAKHGYLPSQGILRLAETLLFSLTLHFFLFGSLSFLLASMVRDVAPHAVEQCSRATLAWPAFVLLVWLTALGFYRHVVQQFPLVLAAASVPVALFFFSLDGVSYQDSLLRLVAPGTETMNLVLGVAVVLVSCFLCVVGGQSSGQLARLLPLLMALASLLPWLFCSTLQIIELCFEQPRYSLAIVAAVVASAGAAVVSGIGAFAAMTAALLLWFTIVLGAWLGLEHDTAMYRDIVAFVLFPIMTLFSVCREQLFTYYRQAIENVFYWGKTHVPVGCSPFRAAARTSAHRADRDRRLRATQFHTLREVRGDTNAGSTGANHASATSSKRIGHAKPLSSTSNVHMTDMPELFVTTTVHQGGEAEPFVFGERFYGGYCPLHWQLSNCDCDHRIGIQAQVEPSIEEIDSSHDFMPSCIADVMGCSGAAISTFGGTALNLVIGVFNVSLGCWCLSPKWAKDDRSAFAIQQQRIEQFSSIYTSSLLIVLRWAIMPYLLRFNEATFHLGVCIVAGSVCQWLLKREIRSSPFGHDNSGWGTALLVAILSTSIIPFTGLVVVDQLPQFVSVGFAGSIVPYWAVCGAALLLLGVASIAVKTRFPEYFPMCFVFSVWFAHAATFHGLGFSANDEKVALLVFLGVWVLLPLALALFVAPIRRLLFLPYWSAFFASLISPDEKNPFLYLSDGGHSENLAAYPLLASGVETIFVFDAEEDPKRKMESLRILAELARTKLGCKIELDHHAIDELSLHNAETQQSLRRCAVFPVRYCADTDKEWEGQLVYCKSTLLQRDPANLKLYQKTDTIFPHTPTSSQFLTPEQVHAYEHLGFVSATEAIAAFNEYRQAKHNKC